MGNLEQVRESEFFKRICAYADWLKKCADELWEKEPGGTNWYKCYVESNAVSNIVNTAIFGEGMSPLPNERAE